MRYPCLVSYVLVCTTMSTNVRNIGRKIVYVRVVRNVRLLSKQERIGQSGHKASPPDMHQ